MKKRFSALALCLVLLLTLFLPSCGEVEDAGSKMTAPDFSVTDVTGATVRLSDYRGKPVVVNFWATWCPPCVGELPHFDKAVETYGDRISFLMVNLDSGQQEDMATAKAFMQENGYSFPVYFDLSYEAAHTYGVSSIPMTVWIDGNGDLVNAYVGALSEDYLTYYIDQMLAD